MANFAFYILVIIWIIFTAVILIRYSLKKSYPQPKNHIDRALLDKTELAILGIITELAFIPDKDDKALYWTTALSVQEIAEIIKIDRSKTYTILNALVFHSLLYKKRTSSASKIYNYGIRKQNN